MFSYVMTVVVMTLLIIEMVAFPLAPERRVEVDLPRVNHPVTMWAASREGALIVVIMRDGRVFFRNERATAGDLTERIKIRLNATHPEHKVYIKADARARYGAIRTVLGAICSAGIENVGFLVEQLPVPAARTRL
jgi:biopolymer transport protein ExbD